jgi:hypothetical protein
MSRRIAMSEVMVEDMAWGTVGDSEIHGEVEMCELGTCELGSDDVVEVHA